MLKPQSQRDKKIKFQTPSPSVGALRLLASKSFARAVERDVKIISSHKVKRK